MGSSQNGNPSRIVGRSSFLFIAGTITVIAGLLFPSSAHIFDVLLIFSVSLTAAVLIITFSARGILEVSGFPLLILLATMLRAALSVASVKFILLQGNAGTIVGLVGNTIAQDNVVASVLILGILAPVIFGTVCKAVKGISSTGTEFITDIAPIKEASIDSDFKAGVINDEQALGLRERLARETGFFVAMAGAAKFILCGAVVELVTIIVNILALMAVGLVGPTSSGISVKIYATLAVGAGMVTQISALLTAVASRYLVRKSSVVPLANGGISEQEFTERIKVVASEVTPCQTAEFQYGSTMSYTEPGEDSCREFTEITSSAASADTKTEKKAIAEDPDWLDESRCIGDANGECDFNLWVCEETKGSDYYEAIAELIGSKSGVQAKTILMGAENVAELPVTVPVNIAMHLAQKDRKCLLIDLDLERDAISKVFDIDAGASSDEAQTKTITAETPTCISNLWVWPASNFGKSNAKSLEEVIAGLESRYDRFIIYAPNIKLWADWHGIAGCIQAVLLFGSKGESKSSSISDFYRLLISNGCAILEPVEVFAEAV